MKKYAYLLILMVFTTLSCHKKIDINSNEEPKPKETEKFSLVGVWEGTFNRGKSSLCEKEYGYTLTITKHEKDLIEGTLKVSVPEDNSYAIYKLKMTFKNNILSIKTQGITKKEERVCSYCRENHYVLKLSKDKKELNGKWKYSGYCSVNEDSNIKIDLKKQKD